MEQRLVNLYNQQAMFCYGNVEWSHKIHEKAADLFTTVNSWLRWIQLILAFIISADIIKISGITSKNGRNDAKRFNISVVTVSNDDKQKMLKKQRKAELSRRTVCKSLPDEK